MAIHRIQLMKNKKTTAVKHQKREIAELLSSKQNEKAQIKVEQIIREDFTIEGLEILEIILSLLEERVKLITNSIKCPSDLLESICTVIWCSKNIQIEELTEICEQFRKKYGTKFIDNIFSYTNLLIEQQQCYLTQLNYLNNDIPYNITLRLQEINTKIDEFKQKKDFIEINERIFNKFLYKPASAYLVVRYLEEISRSYNVEWSPKEDLGIEDVNLLSTILPMKSLNSIGKSVGIALGSGITSAYIQQTVSINKNNNNFLMKF